MRDRQLYWLSLAVGSIGIVSAFVAGITLTPEEAEGGQRWYLAIKNTAYWGTWAALIPAVVHTALLIRNQRWGLAATLGAHAVAGATCATVHLGILSGVDLLGRVWILGQPMSWQAVMRDLAASTPRLIIEWEFTMYAALTAFAYATTFEAELRRRSVSEAELKASLADARLSSLQRQLQPHFLFNTLHAVSSLIRRDPATAETVIEHLGRLLRTTLRTGAAECTLAQDLDALQHYLAIETVQMGDRLKVEFAIDHDVLGGAVPILLMQPLVENSVRHGLQPRARGGRILISARKAGDDLHLEVVDDGIGLQPAGTKGTGVGLANTRSRLEQLYGTRQSFTVAPVESGGVRVTVKVPFRTTDPS
jgi:two-component system LytT family sensor kinase